MCTTDKQSDDIRLPLHTICLLLNYIYHYVCNSCHAAARINVLSLTETFPSWLTKGFFLSEVIFSMSHADLQMRGVGDRGYVSSTYMKISIFIISIYLKYLFLPFLKRGEVLKETSSTWKCIIMASQKPSIVTQNSRTMWDNTSQTRNV